MDEKKENKWIHDEMNHWFTPGGDPVYICPFCGLGRHVYGIEHRTPLYECPDCGRVMEGYEW